MENKVVNENLEEEIKVEEETVKMSFLQKHKKKVIVGLGVLGAAGLYIIAKALTSSDDESEDGYVDVQYTECRNEIEFKEDMDALDQMESQEKSE